MSIRSSNARQRSAARGLRRTATSRARAGTAQDPPPRNPSLRITALTAATSCVAALIGLGGAYVGANINADAGERAANRQIEADQLATLRTERIQAMTELMSAMVDLPLASSRFEGCYDTIPPDGS